MAEFERRGDIAAEEEEELRDDRGGGSRDARQASGSSALARGPSGTPRTGVAAVVGDMGARDGGSGGGTRAAGDAASVRRLRTHAAARR